MIKKIKDGKIEAIFFIPFLIALVFNIKFKGLPPSFFISSILLCGMALFYLYKNRFKFPRRLIKPVSFLCLVILSILMTAIVASSVDFFLLRLIAGIFFVVTVAPYALFSYFKDREIEIVKYICYAGIVNSLFIVSMFLLSGFREFYLSLLNQVDLLHLKGESTLDSLYAMRLIGLTGSATYGMAVTQVIMSFLYVFYINKVKSSFTFLNCSILILLMLSSVLSGRTAFVGFVFLFTYMVLVLSKKDLFRFILMAIIFTISFALLASFYLPSNYYSFFESWILQVFTSGEKIGSVDSNKDMLAAYSFEDFNMWGDFKWHEDESRSSYYMGTDVGWYRFAFAFGFTGVFFIILYLLSYLKFSLRYKTSHLVNFFIISFLLIVMFKGAILFDFYMVFFILTILFFVCEKDH